MSPRASDDRVRTWRRWGLWAISIGSLVLAICVLAAFAFVRHSAHPGARGHSRDRQRRLTTEILKRFVFERPALLHSARDFHNSYPSGHTTIAYAVGIAATIVAPRRAPPGRGRRPHPH
jgi:membrane-associated phospholipid phosphatase